MLYNTSLGRLPSYGDIRRFIKNSNGEDVLILGTLGLPIRVGADGKLHYDCSGKHIVNLPVAYGAIINGEPHYGKEKQTEAHEKMLQCHEWELES